MKIYLTLFFIYSSIFAKTYINDDILKSVEQKYDVFAKERFIYLRDILEQLEDKDELVKLSVINKFFNEVKYKSDIKNYNKSDYWATPFEFLAKDSGDCEDFVIAKYFALIYLNIEAKKLFFLM